MTSNSVILAILLLSIVSFQLASSQTIGTASFYRSPYTPSACNGYNDDGVMIASASEAIYDNKNACGQMYNVTCLGGIKGADSNPCSADQATVIVKIVDFCSQCETNISLSFDAFTSIANEDAGEISISYVRLASS